MSHRSAVSLLVASLVSFTAGLLIAAASMRFKDRSSVRSNPPSIALRTIESPGNLIKSDVRVKTNDRVPPNDQINDGMLGKTEPSNGNSSTQTQSWALFAALGLAAAVAWFLAPVRVAARLSQSVTDVIQTLHQGILIVDRRGCVLTLNAAAARMLGRHATDLYGRELSSLDWVCLRGGAQKLDPWHQAFDSLIPPSEQWMRYRDAEASVRTFAVNAMLCVSQGGEDDTSEPSVVVTMHDVTEIERQAFDRDKMLTLLRQDRSDMQKKNKELHRMASTDPLTQCLNRRSFFTRYEKVFDICRSTGQPLAVLMIDNDRFKLLNDRYGHALGDEVLRRGSDILRQSFDSPALVCRYGGEEFCVLLPGDELTEAVRKAEAARIRISEMTFPEHPELTISVSIGIANNDASVNSAIEIVGNADRALYESKAAGRNRTTVFSHALK